MTLTPEQFSQTEAQVLFYLSSGPVGHTTLIRRLRKTLRSFDWYPGQLYFVISLLLTRGTIARRIDGDYYIPETKDEQHKLP